MDHTAVLSWVFLAINSIRVFGTCAEGGLDRAALCSRGHTVASLSFVEFCQETKGADLVFRKYSVSVWMCSYGF